MGTFELIICFVIGSGLGFAVAWIWARSLYTAKLSAQNNSEKELKTLLAEQAKEHLQTSRDTIKNLEKELASLLTSVSQYEHSLSASNDEQKNNEFFGEHATEFLRNVEPSNKEPIGLESPDAQPKDFSGTASGVFMGTDAVKPESTVEKANH